MCDPVLAIIIIIIVIPIVVGALEVVSTTFKHHTSRLKLPNWIMPLLQKAALLETPRILR